MPHLLRPRLSEPLTIAVIAVFDHLNEKRDRVPTTVERLPSEPACGENRACAPYEVTANARHKTRARAGAVAGKEVEMMVTHRNIAEWHGKQLIDRDGEKIGKLEDVYVDVETDEPVFGTVKVETEGEELSQ